MGGLIHAQKTFYKALTTGDLDCMEGLFSCSSSSSSYSEEVTQVIESGGRIDRWKSCLEEGARPADMVVADCDAWVVTDDDTSYETAYTTGIEFPANAPMEGGTLLAVQRWSRLRISNDDDNTNEWKLTLHQTI